MKEELARAWSRNAHGDQSANESVEVVGRDPNLPRRSTESRSRHFQPRLNSCIHLGDLRPARQPALAQLAVEVAGRRPAEDRDFDMALTHFH